MMHTHGDILGAWKNNMDAEERKLYQNIKHAHEKIGLGWNQHNDLEFASISDTPFRKMVMKNYLDRLNRRQAPPPAPRPEGWSI